MEEHSTFDRLLPRPRMQREGAPPRAFGGGGAADGAFPLGDAEGPASCPERFHSPRGRTAWARYRAIVPIGSEQG